MPAEYAMIPANMYVPIDTPAYCIPEYLMEVVGHCSQCGNPVYGRKTILSEQHPFVRRTCNCTPSNRFLDTMQTK